MAEIKIQKKKKNVWLWILLILIIVLVAWLIWRYYNNNNLELRSVALSSDTVQVYNNHIDSISMQKNSEFKYFINDSTEISNRNKDNYIVEGTNLLVISLVDISSTARTKKFEYQNQTDSLLYLNNKLQADSSEQNKSEILKSIFIKSSNLIEELKGSLNRNNTNLKKLAEEINTRQKKSLQIEIIKQYFKAASREMDEVLYSRKNL